MSFLLLTLILLFLTRLADLTAAEQKPKWRVATALPALEQIKLGSSCVRCTHGGWGYFCSCGSRGLWTSGENPPVKWMNMGAQREISTGKRPRWRFSFCRVLLWWAGRTDKYLRAAYFSRTLCSLIAKPPSSPMLYCTGLGRRIPAEYFHFA